MFEDNILFVNVSKTPNVKVIVQNLFNYKDMQPKVQIQSDEDAIDQLSQLLNHIRPNPILLILDDVWLGSESLDQNPFLKCLSLIFQITRFWLHQELHFQDLNLHIT